MKKSAPQSHEAYPVVRRTGALSYSLRGPEPMSDAGIVPRMKQKTTIWIPLFVTLLLSNCQIIRAYTIKTVATINVYGNDYYPNLVKSSPNDGNVYGLADDGVFFKISATGTFQEIASLPKRFGQLGLEIRAFTAGDDGNFYGVDTWSGYAAFRITRTGEITFFHKFPIIETPYIPGEGSQTYFPEGFHPTDLVNGNDGYLYGITFDGGNLLKSNPRRGERIDASAGTLFRISPAGEFTSTFTFPAPSSSEPSQLGSRPSTLTQGRDGLLYGQYGYAGNDFGGIFIATHGGSPTTLLHFSESSGGIGPLQAERDSIFYGSGYGPDSVYGEIRSLSAGTLKSVFSFRNGEEGGYPGRLSQAKNGNVYGVTQSGGAFGRGTIFRFRPPSSVNTLVSTPRSLGAAVKSVIQSEDGRLYGCSYSGVLFRMEKSLSVHRLSPSELIYSASDDIDAPLQVTNSITALLALPELDTEANGDSGLVADGVTPLLIKYNQDSPPPNALHFDLNLTPKGGKLRMGEWTDFLRVWDGNKFIRAKAATIFTKSTVFYVSGVRAEDLEFDAGSTEITLTFSMTPIAPSSGFGDEIKFKLRKPPVILIHGYNADKSTWSDSFKAILQNARGADFVTNINYGVIADAETKDYPNTWGKLSDLSRMLDSALGKEIESPITYLRKDWAFTRYDVVGHSQGGVLARLLCTEGPGPAGTPPFANAANVFRGRFRRVVTIGSPQNGSTEIYYALKFREAYKKAGPQNDGSFGAESILQIMEAQGLLQPKFDPFRGEIRSVNQLRIDSHASFTAIATRIDPCFPLAKWLLLCDPCDGNIRSQSVYPTGTDGAVDFKSQISGTQANSAVLGSQIAHALPPKGWDVFGVAGAAQTRHSSIANEVATLLDGPTSAFGPAISIDLLSDELRDSIDRCVPKILPNKALIHPGESKLSLFRLSPTENASTACFNYIMLPLAGEPFLSTPNWFVRSFGPEGASERGVSVNVSPNDPTRVSVCVEDSVKGDVFLVASYGSENGALVSATPVLVVSRPSGESLLEIQISLAPQSTLLPDQMVTPEIVATYQNGTKSQIYPGNALFQSSDTKIIEVSTSGLIQANATGSAVLTVSYRGLSAQARVFVSADRTEEGLGASGNGRNLVNIKATHDGVSLTFYGIPGRTYKIQRSSDLFVWTGLATLTATSLGRIDFSDRDRMTTAYYRTVSGP